MATSRPDLIIAIDLGMTCTGVAYVNQSIGSDTIRWIQKWPGRSQANENKVPTILVYPNDQGSNPSPSSWGFISDTPTEQSAENRETKEWFKTYLDEDQLRQRQVEAKDKSMLPKNVEEVEKWYLDYFRFLYQYIEVKLQLEIPMLWRDAKIEFIFSVPTTWKPHPTVERFRSLTARAGFGQHPNHTSGIGLTEAEAAAVHMARESPAIFRESDILLVCDAGGGTTDLSALRVTGTNGISLSLQQIDVVFGANLGSAQIDLAFQNTVQDILEKADRVKPLGIDTDEAAWEMMKSKEYQNAKCDYGATDDTEYFFVAVPRLNKRYTNEAFWLFDGEMRFRRDDLQKLFDIQIIKLFKLIDRQLESIRQKLPNEQVAHLVLSGGLGNSAYIQQQLTTRYAYGSSPFPNATNLQVSVAPDPQLVVCKGIVADRLQKLKSGVSILGWRCCRASYGTICKIEYDSGNRNHVGKRVVKDVADGKTYVVDVVDWFIKQGEPVSVDFPIVKSFRQKIGFKDSHRVFPIAVIESFMDKDLLPFTFDQYCTKLCNVQSDFSTIDLKNFKLKNRRLWNFGEKYYRADYLIKVVLGPADINFELWFDGHKLSKDTPIKVEWMAAAAPAIPAPVEIDSRPLMFQPTPSPMQMYSSSSSPPPPAWDHNHGSDQIIAMKSRSNMNMLGSLNGRQSYGVYS